MSLRKAARGRLLQGGARQGAATEGHTCLTAAAAGAPRYPVDVAGHVE